MPYKDILNEYLPEEQFPENYALLSHYIQLQGTEEAENYAAVLRQNGVDVDNLPRTAFFDIQNGVRFVPERHNFTFIDLFAGIGGFRLAMQKAGGQCVFSSEWDEPCKETYFKNFGEVPFGDITIEATKDLIPEHFSVLCAGFPCQPFSNAGLKKGIEDTRGTLFYHIAEILRDHHPEAVLLENVRGLISNDKGNTIQTILRTITGMGYRCNIPQELIDNGPVKQLQAECSRMVLCAKDFGVPQNRPRIYIVLWRNDIDIEEFIYPEPNNEETRVGNILEENVPSTYTISDRLWEGHQRRKVKNMEEGKGFGYCLFNGDSPYTSTISRRYYKDGSEILIAQEGRNPRKITPREAARLQGFPDDFKIPSSATQAYQQFGNSVAVPVVNRVSEEIVDQILEV